MQNKTFPFHLTIWILLCVFSQTIQAEFESKNDAAFYAISSLKFYLEENLIALDANKDNHVNHIEFTQKDVDHLWQIASSDISILSKVQEAKQYHDEALHQTANVSQYLELCQKSQHLLQILWQDLNPLFNKKDIFFKQAARKQEKYPNFDDNPYITKKMRDRMRPHLVPLHSQLRTSLEATFNSSRILQNEASFSEAGFVTWFHQHKSLVRVAAHSAFPEYLFKVYLDTDPSQIRGELGWKRLTCRCEGAENIRRLIKRKGIVHFSVPDKWLYPLSTVGADQESVQPVLLIVTNMNLASHGESVEAWKTKITPSHLEELYCIFSHGFASTFLIHNIPYCRNGKFACIDTEYPKRNLNLNSVKKYLSPEMQVYWDELVKKGGKSG